MAKRSTTASWIAAAMLGLAIALVCQCEAAEPSNEECLSCHGRPDLKSRLGASRYIDPELFARSIHPRKGVGCISCHEGITEISRKARSPHVLGMKPKCGECHERASAEYSKSIHAQVSEKLCYSCHNPHYSISFRQMSPDERKGICLKCHDATRTHGWLPQRWLHFNYLECTSCHAENAQIGIIFYVVDKSDPDKVEVLRYDQLERFMEPGKPDLVANIDTDGNGKISDSELRSFMNKLQEGGRPGAALEVRILVINPSHAFSSKGERTKDCTLCHSQTASFYAVTLLEVPEKGGGFKTIPVEKGILARRGQQPFMEDFYLLGESKIRREDLQELIAVVKRIGIKGIDLIGSFMVLSALAAVALHAFLMFLTRKVRQIQVPGEDFEPISVGVRAWHWIHGLCIVLLVLTGFQLRLPDSVRIFATFQNAVNLHNLCGIIVICDYVFWVSYHLWRKELKSRFFISPGDFFKDTTAMLRFYNYGIFVGENFPRFGHVYSAFDPLERVFFLTNMFVFLPLQFITGLLLYDVQRTMSIVQVLGGLRVVDAFHLYFGYLLIACTVVHVYFHSLKKYHRLTVV